MLLKMLPDTLSVQDEYMKVLPYNFFHPSLASFIFPGMKSVAAFGHVAGCVLSHRQWLDPKAQIPQASIHVYMYDVLSCIVRWFKILNLHLPHKCIVSTSIGWASPQYMNHTHTLASFPGFFPLSKITQQLHVCTHYMYAYTGRAWEWGYSHSAPR